MTDKHAQMREMARGLIRDSVIEDAIAQRIAQIVEFIHEDRIKPLEAKLAKAVEALDRIGKHMVMSMAVDEGHLCRLMKAHANATLEELNGDKQ